MYRAIIGDLSGAIYEYSQIKKVHSIMCNNIIEQNSFFNDSTKPLHNKEEYIYYATLVA